MAKQQMNIRIDPELYVDLKRLAAEDDRSLNSYVERVLKRWASRRKEGAK